MAGGYFRGMAAPPKNPIFQKNLLGSSSPYTRSRGNSITNGSGQPYNYNAQYTTQYTTSGYNKPVGVDGRIDTRIVGQADRLGPQAYAALARTKGGGYSPNQSQVQDVNQQLGRQFANLQLNKPNSSANLGAMQSNQSNLMNQLGQYRSGAKGYDPGPYEQYLNSQQQQASGQGSMDEGSNYSSFSQDPTAFSLDTWRQIRGEEDARAQRNRKQDNETAAWAFFATQLANAFNPVPYDTTTTARLASQWR